jgi:hypothetical protein
VHLTLQPVHLQRHCLLLYQSSMVYMIQSLTKIAYFLSRSYDATGSNKK